MVSAVVLAVSACTGDGRSVDPAPRVIDPTAPPGTPARAPLLALEPGWQAGDPGPLASRIGAAAVWTGDEVLIWGGRNDEGALRDGAAFDPETGRVTAQLTFGGEVGEFVCEPGEGSR